MAIGKIKINGVSFKQVKCSKSKNEIAMQAEAWRRKGHNARMIDNDTHFCLYVGPKKTKRAKAKAKGKKK